MIDNPRYPHVCKIYRKIIDNPFADESEVVLYEGACRKWSQNALRVFSRDNVIKGDFSLSIGGQIEGVMVGDLIDVTDRQGTLTECVVTDAYTGNLGTSVFFNVPMN